ncbi:MAG: hypothetical protein HYR72_16545 [Deltaproteobacteria bacterium]|nr:hypothetical protein [Deltaproteobacteria bacterium]MBI3386758.1 hypothetical protein [Deltaproteobacteria bacterium]
MMPARNQPNQPNPHERITAIVALAIFLACCGALFASCGGEDLTIPGVIVLPTSADTPVPTETPA